MRILELIHNKGSKLITLIFYLMLGVYKLPKVDLYYLLLILDIKDYEILLIGPKNHQKCLIMKTIVTIQRSSEILWTTEFLFNIFAICIA